jgi:TRAP-type mannitol/chloroaromatic compound transport system substrate-binding protein
MAACARIYPNWKKFREEEYPWFRVAEQTCDNFVLAGSG